ncbi:MAG TPA: hypothetical protein VGG99_13820 [Acetobacteraceae bacterium]|jgi:predicted secreted protein
MRRLLLCMTALATLAAQIAQTEPAEAQEMQCLTPQERAVFDIQALRSEVMVLATGCSDDAAYNAFIERYRPELMANERAIDAWFKQHFGRGAQTAHDSFVTDLANAHSDAGSKLGSEFCPRNGMIFQEVMALQRSSELPAFAAGQDLMPASINVCSEVPERGRTRKIADRK